MTKCRLKDADRLQLEFLPRSDLCIGGQAQMPRNAEDGVWAQASAIMITENSQLSWLVLHK